MNSNTQIHVGSRMKFSPSEIIFFESDINYTRLHLVDGRIVLVSTTLGKLEPRFASFNFFRTHRSYLVNLAYVVAQISENNSLKLSNNVEIIISRRKASHYSQLQVLSQN